MNHVTDEHTDRSLGRDLQAWFEETVAELPDGDELPIDLRADVLSRLSSTPQRRRWWPLIRFPLGSRATRSARPEEPRAERRTRSMFSAIRITAGTAVFTLVASLALVAGPHTGGPAGPGVESYTIDPDDFGGFSGTMLCATGDYGDSTATDWGSSTVGETYPRCGVEASDPRISGNSYSVHDYYRYDFAPQWGVRRFASVITNENGSWISTDGWGYQQPEDGTMFYAARFRGTDAYEGLSALFVLSQDVWGLRFDVEGVIFPGDLPALPEPPIEAATASD
jgi:hypothetical protein